MEGKGTGWNNMFLPHTTTSWGNSSLSNEKKRLVNPCVLEEAHGSLHHPQALAVAGTMSHMGNWQCEDLGEKEEGNMFKENTIMITSLNFVKSDI